MIVQPMRAIVVPRVISPTTGEALPIVDQIGNYLNSSVHTIRLSGNGKSIALAHVAYELDGRPDIRIVDDQRFDDIQHDTKSELLIFGSSEPGVDSGIDVQLQIASWTNDELIEYLLAVYPRHCKSVMTRIQKADDKWIAGGSPQVWSLILEEMVHDSSIRCIESALLKIATKSFPSEHFEAVKSICLMRALGEPITELNQFVVETKLDASSRALLRHSGVRLVLAAEKIHADFENERPVSQLGTKWCDRLIELVANRIKNANHPQVLQHLNEIANSPADQESSMAASLLIRWDRNWRPTISQELLLCDAELKNAQWRGLNFDKVILNNSNLYQADLSGSKWSKTTASAVNGQQANFSDSVLDDCQLSKAVFSGASFRDVIAKKTNFSEAVLNRCDFRNSKCENSDFSNADLTSANLDGSDMTGCLFYRCRMGDARFAGAVLDFCNFFNVDLRNCDFQVASCICASFVHSNFEDMSIRDLNLNGSDFRSAILSGTKLRDCQLLGAKFADAKLADIDWENCDLRDASFDGCHFHMGSTRCGLVDSPYPSHGTRTGYYTDEFDEQYFRRPEEMRKANMSGCDLRGAQVEHADFYLVDLRGARFENHQRDHFQKCRAILDN